MQTTLLQFFKPKKKFKCNKCGREFETIKGLKIHLASHRRHEFFDKRARENYINITIKTPRELFEKWDKVLKNRNIKIEDLLTKIVYDYLSIDPKIIFEKGDYFT